MKFEELFKPKPGSLAAEMQKTIDGLNQEIKELRAHAERVGQANDRLAVENAALREVLNLTVDRLMFYMECIPMAHKDYIKTLEGKISYEIVNKSLILLKKEAQP